MIVAYSDKTKIEPYATSIFATFSTIEINASRLNGRNTLSGYFHNQTYLDHQYNKQYKSHSGPTVTIHDDTLNANINIIKTWEEEDHILSGLNKLTFDLWDKKTCNITTCMKIVGTCLAGNKTICDAIIQSGDYSSIIQCITLILTGLRTIVTYDNIPGTIKDITVKYTNERNAEGTYINDTLRDIQNALIARSAAGRKSDSVDMCSLCVCHPFLPSFPCFDDQMTPMIKSTILADLDLRDDAHVILMGVIDVGENAKEPVPWMYDENIQQILAIDKAINNQPALALWYTYIEHREIVKDLYRIIGKDVTESNKYIVTLLESLNAKIAKVASIKSLRSLRSLDEKVNYIADLYKHHNQASMLGIIHFLDTVTKSGMVAPCMRMKPVGASLESMFVNMEHIVATPLGAKQLHN
jgi:hypothetical protein